MSGVELPQRGVQGGAAPPGRRRRGLPLAVLALLLLAACAAPAPQPQATQAPTGKPTLPPAGAVEKPSLKLGIPVPASSFLPEFVGAKTTFHDEGLDVEIATFRGDAEVSQALAGGSVDVNVASINGLANMISAGQPVRGFYAGFDQSDFDFVARPEIKAWADLKGKSIGVSTFGSLTDSLVRAALRKHSLEPERDVQIVQSGGTPNAVQAMKGGQIQAAILSRPNSWQLLDEGYSLLGTQASEIAEQWPKHIFIAKTDFLEKNPNTLRALLRGHVSAIRLIRANRDLGVQAIVDTFKFDRPYAERAYDDVITGWDEKGELPAQQYMDAFWQIAMATGDVTEPWPESKFLDGRYIDTFDQWAPK
jgi:NitT/TauT family transport system substrate-binding protein